MQTSRILLRPWRESDAETLYQYASDPEVGPRAGWPPHQSVEESREIIRTVFHSDHIWAIELKATGEAIGCIGYYTCGESNIDIGENDAEAGYWVARPYWNQGICTEALHRGAAATDRLLLQPERLSHHLERLLPRQPRLGPRDGEVRLPRHRHNQPLQPPPARLRPPGEGDETGKNGKIVRKRQVCFLKEISLCSPRSPAPLLLQTSPRFPSPSR